jgi:hypothetical protein
MISSSRLIGSEDEDGFICAHPDDATTIAHTKSKLHDREFFNRVLDSNSGAFDSNSTMARTSNTSYIGRLPSVPLRWGFFPMFLRYS